MNKMKLIAINAEIGAEIPYFKAPKTPIIEHKIRNIFLEILKVINQ